MATEWPKAWKLEIRIPNGFSRQGPFANSSLVTWPDVAIWEASDGGLVGSRVLQLIRDPILPLRAGRRMEITRIRNANRPGFADLLTGLQQLTQGA